MRWIILALLLLCNPVFAQDWARIFYEEDMYCCQAVTFTRPGYGYLFGGPTLRVSNDNGYTWQEDPNWPYEVGCSSMTFHDSLQGIARLDDYACALTFDGGLTWHYQSTNGVPIGDPIYVNDSILVSTWAWSPDGFGTDLYVTVSVDRGYNWFASYHVENLISGDSFTNLTSGGDGSIYATSFFYGLIKSYDLGATWIPVDVQPSNRVECLACPSSGVVLVTRTATFQRSDSIFIARSEDHGMTWVTVWTDTLISDYLEQSAFVDSLFGWSVGANGTILNTTDGGQTWQRDSIQLPQYSYVASVEFLSRLEGWILFNYFDWNPHWNAHSLYAYRDAQIDARVPQIAVPSELDLTTYPNPFNSTVRIDYELPRASDINVSIFNTLGQEVATLFTGRADAGAHTLNWTPDATSGVYFVKLEAAAFVKTQKLLYIR